MTHAQQTVQEMFVEHSQKLLAFFRSSRKMSKHDAADLLQQTFEEVLKTLERRPGYEIHHPRGFLFRVARYQLAALARKQQRRAELQEAYSTTETCADAEADDLEYQASLRTEHRLLFRAMRRLSRDVARSSAVTGHMAISEPQEIIYLRFFASLTLAEIADVFDIPLGTVPGRLRRALRMLTRQVKLLESSDADVGHTSTTEIKRWRSALEREARFPISRSDERAANNGNTERPTQSEGA